MPAKIFVLPKKANKSIAKLPLNVQNRIDAAFDVLKENPLAGAKLHGELEVYYKYRVGDYRIIYRFAEKMSTIEIVKIEHRQGVYK